MQRYAEMGTESESGLLEMVKTKERILNNQSKTRQADSYIKRAAGEGYSLPEVALAPLQHSSARPPPPGSLPLWA